MYIHNIRSINFGLFCAATQKNSCIRDQTQVLNCEVIFAIVAKKGNNRPKSVKFFIEFIRIRLEASFKLRVIFAVVTKKGHRLAKKCHNFSSEKKHHQNGKQQFKICIKCCTRCSLMCSRIVWHSFQAERSSRLLQSSNYLVLLS